MPQSTVSYPPLRIRPPRRLDVEAYVHGWTEAEVIETLPLLFNLCKETQAAALRLALGRGDLDQTRMAAELRREHLLKLCIMLPRHLGLPPVPYAHLEDGQILARLLDGGLPHDGAAFEVFLASRTGLAPLLATIRDCFAPSEACTQGLLTTSFETVFEPVAQENSVAARHAAHPLMQHIARNWGHGPLWRVVARMLDLEAILNGQPPRPHQLEKGRAVAPAARGFYALDVTSQDGRVVALNRVTPTDHILAQGGAMEQSLASLPPAKHDLAPLVVEILDPCVPVELEGGASHA